MSFKEYASKEYVHEYHKNKESLKELVFDYITLTDRSNGYDYYVYVLDGELTSILKCTGIEVTTLPTKSTYTRGDVFDPTGMVVTVTYPDGSTKEVDNLNYFSYNINNVIDNEFVINYTDDVGNMVSTTVILNITEFDPAVRLIDFTYTTNSDGTYTLTGWKETLNGEPSTEMIIPDNALIIL